MERTETLEDFYMQKQNWLPDNLKKEMGHFNVFRMEDFAGKHNRPVPYSRKDFYKISLMSGKYKLQYASRSIDVDQQQALIFSNPMVPYKFESLEGDPTGVFCIFTESFFRQFGQIRDYPIFQPTGNPVLFPSEEQTAVIRAIFQRMHTELNSDYAFKYDLLRNLVFELAHFALKMQPAPPSIYSSSNGATRISSLFMELLERQFPIESTAQQVRLQSPSDFADHLSVHVNHLNRALKETTGKTTSRLIAERITQEAKSLLLHTNWNISEIGWSLGFEEAPHFINFFRKNADLSPGAFRQGSEPGQPNV